MIADPKPTFRAWLIVALLWLTVLFNYLTRLLPTTMHGSIVAAMPMTEAQFGLLTSVLFWTYGLVSPFAGFVSDRFSRSKVIIGTMFLWSMITWLTSYARTFEQLLMARALTGLAEACYYPAALALICDYHRGATRSLATAIHQSGYIIGVGLSGLGGWLAEVRSWHFAFGAVGLAGVAFSVPLALLLRDAPEAAGEDAAALAPAATRSKSDVRLGAAFASLFSSGSFFIMFFNMALLGVVGYTVMSWMPVFFQERFHLTQAVAGISVTGSMNGASLPGLLIGGIWADRWSRTNPRARMFVLAIGLLACVPGILLTSNTHVYALAVLGLVMYRLFGSFFEANSMPILCDVVDLRYRGTAYGLLNLVACIGAGLGIYFSGVLRDSNVDLHLVFNTFPAVTLLCAILAFFVRARRSAAAPPVAILAAPLPVK